MTSAATTVAGTGAAAAPDPEAALDSRGLKPSSEAVSESTVVANRGACSQDVDSLAWLQKLRGLRIGEPHRRGDQPGSGSSQDTSGKPDVGQWLSAPQWPRQLAADNRGRIGRRARGHVGRG